MITALLFGGGTAWILIFFYVFQLTPIKRSKLAAARASGKGRREKTGSYTAKDGSGKGLSIFFFFSVF